MENKSFDDILENKIGFGKYQVLCFITLAIVQMNEGIHSTVISSLNLVIQKQFGYSKDFMKTVIFVSYLAMGIGSIASGILSIRYGRWIILFVNSILHCLTGFSQMFIVNEYVFLVIRIIYGISYGMCLGIVILTITETAPLKYRARCIVSLNQCQYIGVIYCLIMAQIFLTSFTDGEWKKVILYSTLPNILVPFLMWFFFYESPRYLVTKNKITEAVAIMNKMGKRNHEDRYQEITEQEIINLENWRQELYKNKQNPKYSELFGKSTMQITWRIFFIYSAMAALLSVITLIDPYLYSSSNKDFISLIWIAVGTIPAFIFCFYFVEQRLFGRRISATIFFSLSSICFLLLLLLVQYHHIDAYQFIEVAFAFCFKSAQFFVVILCQEGFPTHLRSAGSSTGIALASFAGAITPFFIFDLYSASQILPYAFALGLVLLCTYAAFTFPIDLTGKQLEDLRKSQVKMESENLQELSCSLIQPKIEPQDLLNDIQKNQK